MVKMGSSLVSILIYSNSMVAILTILTNRILGYHTYHSQGVAVDPNGFVHSVPL